VESDNIFEIFNAPPTIDENKELELHIKNMDRLPVPNAKDPNSILIWWKVWIILIGNRSFFCFDHKLKCFHYFHFQDHFKTYPVLLPLARDYLACSASSCAVEHNFSAAADV